MILRLFRLLSVLSAASLIAACGGSSGGGTISPPPPPPPPPSGWQQGVFDPYINFFARCENPRPGEQDIQGTLLDENNFLRSYSNDTYLWYDEIVDQDPGLFNDPVAYFAELKTFEEIAPGVPKDPNSNHFTFDTDEWRLLQAGVSFGYGAEFVYVSLNIPREIVVAFVEPNTPASQGNIARGARIVGVDGFDIDTNTQAGVDALNAAFFNAQDGDTHTFSVLDLGAQTPRDVVMTAGPVTEELVKNVDVIDTPTGRVGYLTFMSHRPPAEEAWVDAINFFNSGQGIDDLVLDLRYNGGGLLDMASQIAYMIAGPAQTNGKIFERLQFNDKHPTVDPVTGQTIQPVPFETTTLGWENLPVGQPLPTLNLTRLFVLTGPGTCSASEAIMNGLRGADVEVIQIGNTTCGKPYGFYPTDNCGTTYFTVQFKGVNNKGFGDYPLGFRPAAVDDGEAQVAGCGVNDDFTKPLGDVGENRLEVALAYRDGQGCITPSADSQQLFSKPGMRLDDTEGWLNKSPFDSNRILARPGRE